MKPACARTRPDQRGVALVEFSLVVVILMAITLALITGGITYTKKLSLRTAAREGARYGATLPVANYASTSAWLDAVANATKGATNGDWKTTDNGASLCVALIDAAGSVTARREVSAGTSIDSSPCYTDGVTGQSRVQVTIQTVGSFNGVFAKSTPTLTASASARVETDG